MKTTESISFIFLKLKQDWERVLGFSVRIEDNIKPSKLQSHLLWSASLKHGYVIDSGTFSKGGKVSSILQSCHVLNDSSSCSLKNSTVSLSFYFYSDSLAFRRGPQPLNSNFTYPFIVNNHFLSTNINSNISLFIRGRGGLTFNKLFSLIGTDIGYMGSFLSSKLDPHTDILVFQFGIVDFCRYRNSFIYNASNLLRMGCFLDHFYFNYFFKRKFKKLSSYLSLINGNFKSYIFSIGSVDNRSDTLLIKINQFLHKNSSTNFFYIDTTHLKSDCYLDEGHLTELGHSFFAQYLIYALNEFSVHKIN